MDVQKRRFVHRTREDGQGRLNQWAHWARAEGPGFFFFLRDPQLAVVNFFKLIAVHCLCNTKQTYSKGLFFRCAGIVADNGAKNAANFLP